MKKASISTIIGVSMVILCVLGAIDALLCDERFSLHLFTQADCEFVVPDGYAIVTNGKMYAVKQTKYWDDTYLWHSGFRITTMYSTISTPSLFFNECKAKGYLKKYLKQIEPRAKKFIEVKK